MTIGNVHLTKRYARYRIKSPSKFQKGTFKTIDVGRIGHTKIIIGRPKGQETTEAQAVLISIKDYEHGIRLKDVQWRKQLKR